MKPSHYIKEVKKSDAFKDFAKEDPSAYLCSLFFIRDFTGPQNETQVDFYSPKNKNIISFKVGKGVERIPIPKKAETMTHKKLVPKPLSEKIRMDLDKLKPTLVDEMRNRDMTYEIEKMLVVLNVVDDRPVWNCTSFLKGLGLLQAHIEDQSQSILFMEKKSLFDMLKFAGPGVPGMGMGGMPGGSEQPGLGGTENIKVMSPQELAAEIQKAKAAKQVAAKPSEKPAKKNSTKSEKK